MKKSNDVIFDKFIQIKMLILFVMSRLPHPVSVELLTELTMFDERISYFDVTECVDKLAKTKHLRFEDNKYSITAKGLRNGKILEEDLPYSVKLKAEEAASHIGAILARDSLIKTRRDAAPKGGYNVVMSLSDGAGDILSVELYTANEQQAAKLENGFHKNAESLYRDIVDIICK